MKILLLADSINVCNGAAKHILLLAKHLTKRGHKILLLTGSIDEAKLAFGFEIKVSNLIGHQSRSIINFFSGVFLLKNIISDFKPDIVHSHHFYNLNLARFVVKKTKLIFTVHGILPKVGFLPHLPCKNIIAGSKEIKNYIEANSSQFNKPVINLIPFSTSFEKLFTTKLHKFKVPKINKNEVVIGFVGRLVEVKGINVFLDALDNLKIKNKLKVIIVGEGPLEIRNCFKNKNIELLKFNTTTEINNFYKIFDVVVVPSLGLEGLPLVLLEAGISGKPVIASNVNGFSDLITHDKNGLLFEAGNSDELARELTKLILSKTKRELLGSNFRKYILNNNNLKSMIDKTAELYLNTIK